MSKANPSSEAGRVIILSGPIGSGKTTVAKLLLPSLPGPTCYIEGDLFWSYIAKSGKRTKRENFQVIMRSMTAAALPFARSGFTVLLDFSIPPDFLTTIRAILKEIPFDYVVLCPSLEVCVRRAAERAEGKIADYGPFHSFYDLFQGVRDAIKEDKSQPEEITRRIHALIAAGTLAG